MCCVTPVMVRTNGMPAVVKKKNSHGEPIEVNLTMEVDLQGNLL